MLKFLIGLLCLRLKIQRSTILPGPNSQKFRSRKVNQRAVDLILLRPLNHTISSSVDLLVKEINSEKRRPIPLKYFYKITFFQSAYGFK